MGRLGCAIRSKPTNNERGNMNASNAAKRLECDGWDYEVTVEPEQEPIDGHFATGSKAEDDEQEQWIRDQLNAGNEYAWCCVLVTATESNPRPGFKARVGHNSLGCCSYLGRKALMDMVWRDMKPEARSEALGQCPKLEPEAARAAYDTLMRDRCSNYGYDHTAWRRISNQRSRARLAVRILTENGKHPERLNWHAAGDRLTFERHPHTGLWSCHYVVGQSSNEEITNLLRRLVNPEAKWQS